MRIGSIVDFSKQIFFSTVLFLITTVNANATKFKPALIFEECGIYQVDGRIKISDSSPGVAHLNFLIEEKSFSEVEINIGSKREYSKFTPNPSDYEGINVTGEIEILSPCFHQCKGRLVKIIRRLEPYEKPAPQFKNRPHPIRQASCERGSAKNSVSGGLQTEGDDKICSKWELS